MAPVSIAKTLRAQHGTQQSHRWTALVQPCALCGNFAARWRCAPCRESYCAACHARVHSHGRCLAHECDRLGYYTAETRLRDERIFGAGTYRLLQKARRESARAAEPFIRDRAAVMIQRTHRAICERRLGINQLRDGRRSRKFSWQQQWTVTLPRANGYSLLHLGGLTQNSFSSENERLIMKRIAFWKQTAQCHREF